MDVKLRVQSGKHAGKSIRVTKKQFIVGRGENCHLRAGSEMVSRQHTMFTLADDYFGVEDLGSKNGTLVNGEKIEAPRKLATGDVVVVGPLEFKVELIGAPETKAVETKSPKPAKTGDTSSIDDMIGDWLGDSGGGSNMASRETQTISQHDTEEIQRKLSGEDDKSTTTDEAEETPARPNFDAPKAKDSREAAANILNKLARRR